MASEITSLGEPRAWLVHTSQFKVSDESILPLDFLPEETTINIGGGPAVYELSWTYEESGCCSIKGLAWDPWQGLNGTNVPISITTAEGIVIFERCANVCIVPRLFATICFGPLGTATTGTFVAQASPDGYGEPGFVKSIEGHSADTFPQLGASNPATHAAK